MYIHIYIYVFAIYIWIYICIYIHIHYIFECKAVLWRCGALWWWCGTFLLRCRALLCLHMEGLPRTHLIHTFRDFSTNIHLTHQGTPSHTHPSHIWGTRCSISQTMCKTYIYINMYIWDIHTYIHIYIHTYIYIYIYM